MDEIILAGGEAANTALARVRAQIQMIQVAMREHMKEGTHYGKVPGCGDKQVLLKPGAELIGVLFGLRQEIAEETVTDSAGGHREYAIKVRMVSRISGATVGEGVGVATTRERKYRFRSESTGALVPAEYWRSRDPALLGGSEFTARKVVRDWFIFRQVEHDAPEDYYNTVRKMAFKRAAVHASINATACSDIFDQDLEERYEQDGAPSDSPPEPPLERPRSAQQAPAAPAPNDQPPPAEQHAGTPRPRGDECISEAQRKRMFALLKQSGKPEAELRAYLAREFSIEHSDELRRKDYNEVCNWLVPGSNG